MKIPGYASLRLARGKRQESIAALGTRASDPQGVSDTKASPPLVREPPARKGQATRRHHHPGYASLRLARGKGHESIAALGTRASGSQGVRYRKRFRFRTHPQGADGQGRKEGTTERTVRGRESSFLTPPSPFVPRGEEWKRRSKGSSCHHSRLPSCTQRNSSKRNPFSTTIIVLPS